MNLVIATLFRLGINQLALFRPRLLCIHRLLRCLASVELPNDLGVDAVQLLLGEDAQQRPRQVQGLEDRSRFIRSCTTGPPSPTMPKPNATTDMKPYLVQQTAARTCPGIPVPACPPQTTPPPQPLPSSPLHLVRSRISHTVACHPRELAMLCISQHTATHQLIRHVTVVLPRQLFADRTLHQPRQRRQHINGWVYLSVVQLPIDEYLSFGNIPCQVRNRVRDICACQTAELGKRIPHTVIRHGQDGNLSNRPVPALHTARAFVNGRQVCVHISGVATTSRYLFASCRNLPRDKCNVK